ncbi:plant PDR ABC transporter associated protein [Tanacetum coccineum]
MSTVCRGVARDCTRIAFLAELCVPCGTAELLLFTPVCGLCSLRNGGAHAPCGRVRIRLLAERLAFGHFGPFRVLGLGQLLIVWSRLVGRMMLYVVSQVTQFSTRPPLKLRICLVPTYGKQLDTGEMLVGPANVFLMDETSNGLDSSTTYRITNFLGQMVNSMDLTMVISLLKPDPETYKLFYDVILMSKGQIVYQGPCENALEFFELMGFRCPERKDVADFLQESFHIGQKLEKDIHIPYDKCKTRPDAVVKEKYASSSFQLLKACFEREWLLSKCNSLLYIFETFQLTFMSLLSLTVVRLPIFYKQRDSLLYPAWAFSIPIWLFRIPLSLMESGIWVVLTYYNIGFAPDATRFSRQFLTFFAIHQMALSLFRLIAAVARTEMTLQAMDVMGILCFSMYAQNALVIDDFLDKRWSRVCSLK